MMARPPLVYSRRCQTMAVLVLFLATGVQSKDVNKWGLQSSGRWKLLEPSWLEKNWRKLLLVIFTVILIIVLFRHVYRLRINDPVIGVALEMTPTIRSMLESFPTLTFSSDKEVGRGDTFCPVCRIDFMQGETILSLPVCMHVFHLECIDMCWTFVGEARCPYCRHDYTSWRH